MGYSSYTSDAAATLRNTTRDRETKAVGDIFVAPVGRALDRTSIPKEVDPFGVDRECRDSAAHPNSVGIIVGFDTTGSMNEHPITFATKALPHLMEKLTLDGFCEDPAVLFASFNDNRNGHGGHPLQVGQFESGLEVDDDLTRLPLQGGGGGTMEENSEMLIYWASRHASMDCLEKRGKKGYLFLVTDEKPYPTLSSKMVKEAIGDDLQGDMSTEEVITEARAKFEIFVILPEYAGGGRVRENKLIRERWEALLGAEFVLPMQDASGVADQIATTIGIREGRVPASPAAPPTDAPSVSP